MRKNIVVSIFVAFVIAVAISLVQSCSTLSPLSWVPSEAPLFEGELITNNALRDVAWVDLDGWYGPEDFAFDQEGNAYCGVHAEQDEFNPGAIMKITPDGEVSEYMKTSSWVTGMHFNKQNELLAIIHGIGLVSIKSPDKMDTLVWKLGNGQQLMTGTGLDVSSDGKVYFASLSSSDLATPKFIQKLILEQRKTGGVFCYDPNLNETTVISDGNYFANGVALSENEDYLLVSETSKYRILRYWLKGDKAGIHDIFLDNLPGFPNNITRRKNGNFWVGFTTKRNAQLDELHPKTGMKKLVYALPEFLKPKAEPFGMIIEYSPDGSLVRTLFDPTGAEVAEAGAVSEFDGRLYIGGDVASGVAILDLKKK